MVWFCKNKTCWKFKIVLHEYRYFNCMHKNTWFYKDIAGDVGTRFGTSNYELDRPLS